ncbi:MAG: hypothetical protein IJO87_00120 [Eggerthellaceae bacterium]|nr:hypothetical protein [Eggerthellaceae bacterium]
MSVQIVDAAYVAAHLEDEFLLDLRPEFMYDSTHIPGAKNIDFWFLKTQNGFTLPTRLAGFVTEMGVGANDPIIVYCQSGQMSTEAVGMLEAQGFTEVRHYEAGWSDWASDRSRPREETPRNR